MCSSKKKASGVYYYYYVWCDGMQSKDDHRNCQQHDAYARKTEVVFVDGVDPCSQAFILSFQVVVVVT